MTTPAPPAKTAAAKPAPDPVAAAVTAIARHITGQPIGEEHSALVALGLDHDQAQAVVDKTPNRVPGIA
jgi:hypothetical protein